MNTRSRPTPTARLDIALPNTYTHDNAVNLYAPLKKLIANRGVPTDEVIERLVEVIGSLPDEVFVPNDLYDVYSSVAGKLGPYLGLLHRKAVMADVLMVLGELESSDNWNEGADTNNPEETDPWTWSAGIFQISPNSRNLSPTLREISPSNPVEFRAKMLKDHAWAITYAVHLLRITTHHNGPVRRHEIDEYLSKDAVACFLALLA